MSRDSDVVESELFALASEWKERALAAEQRAEAAEAERDRMRPVVEAALMWSKWNPKHGLLAAIDAYRAGHPATSEAERIAATLVCSTCNDTHRMTLGDREGDLVRGRDVVRRDGRAEGVVSNSGTLTSGSWCCGSWVFAPRCSECGRRQDVATHAPERVRILRESMAILGRNLAVAGALERARLAGYVLGFYWESNDGLWRPNVNGEAAP